MARTTALLLLWLCAVSAAMADTHYVSPSGCNASPYTTWEAAAWMIQDAVDVAASGDEVLVGDGIYSNGEHIAYGMTNRVVATNAITVRSVNGPASTVIAGRGPCGTNAIRCVVLGNNAFLSGFTITNGNTFTGKDGGGVFANTLSGTISNCIVRNCSADSGGGGTYRIYAYNCLFFSNTAYYGGAAYNGELRGCTISNNAGTFGGGTYYALISNCIVYGCTAQIGGGADGGTISASTLYGNQATSYYGGASCQAVIDRCEIYSNSAAGDGGGDYGSSIRNSLIRNNQATGMGGGVAAASLLNCTVVSNFTSQSGGGCYQGAITNCIVYYNRATFFSNNTYRTPAVFSCTFPDLGGSNITNAPLFVNPSTADYRLMSNSPCIDSGTNVNAGKDLAGMPRPQDGNVDQLFVCDMGAYEFPPDSPFHYVSLSGLNNYPFTNWVDASTNLQTGVDAASAGDTVFVSNGVYSTGARVSGDGVSNRVVVSQAVLIQNASSPSPAIIEGAGPLGNTAVRCIYLSSGAILDGFTLSNGFTHAGGTWTTEQAGGGAWCAADAVLTNCMFIGNTANGPGGGLYGGKGYFCTFTNNTAGNGSGTGSGGGLYGTWLYKCTMARNMTFDYGGAASESTLIDCDLVDNVASNSGGQGTAGGAYNCILRDSRVLRNYGHGSAGGIYGGSLSNCTVSSNQCRFSGGGVYGALILNSLISNNIAGTTAGGAVYCIARGSVITFNTSSNSGGGTCYGTNINCTISHNLSTAGWGGGGYDSVMLNSTIYSNECTVIGGGGFYGGSASNCIIVGNRAENGGGVYQCTSCVNSVIASNYALSIGGGAAYTDLKSCNIFSNQANGGLYSTGGGGTYAGSAMSCLYSNNWSDGGGGGANSTFITNSILVNNWTRLGGGGALGGSLFNCLVVSNYCQNQGGGLYNSRATHCTIVSNLAYWGEGGGTAYQMTVTNCIIYYNSSEKTSVHNNYDFGSSYGYTCTWPNPGGPGNTTNEPGFADLAGWNFRLTAPSPCIDTATNVGLLFDYDIVPRPLDGNTNGVSLPDMGAYEFAHPFGDTDGDGMTDPWELSYGFSPTNNTDALLDSDGDGITNRSEFIADTNPTNVQSYFKIAAVSNMPSIMVCFASSSNRHYTLEYNTNLVSGVWTNVPEQTNLVGNGWMDYISDTNSTDFRCYRVRAIFP